MPRACTVCSHPALPEINKALLVERGSKRAIAGRFGVTDSAVQRHRVGCLGQTPAKKVSGDGIAPVNAPEAVRFAHGGEIKSPAQLLERLQSLFRLGDLLEEAYGRRDVDACVKLAREVRGAVESYAKVAGWLTDGANVSVAIDARKQSAIIGNLTEAELRALAHGKPIEGEFVELPGGSEC